MMRSKRQIFSNIYIYNNNNNDTCFLFFSSIYIQIVSKYVNFDFVCVYIKYNILHMELELELVV